MDAMGGTGVHRQYRESLWPVPRTTRHVWVNRGTELPPLQGLVLEWRRHSYKWSALVVFVDDTEPEAYVQQWFKAEMLTPVPAKRADLPRRNGRPGPHS